jgi:hypothetical protein
VLYFDVLCSRKRSDDSQADDADGNNRNNDDVEYDDDCEPAESDRESDREATRRLERKVRSKRNTNGFSLSRFIVATMTNRTTVNRGPAQNPTTSRPRLVSTTRVCTL